MAVTGVDKIDGDRMPFFSSPFPCRDSKRPDGIAVYGKKKQYFLFILKMESIIKNIFKLKVLVYFLQFLFFLYPFESSLLIDRKLSCFPRRSKGGRKVFLSSMLEEAEEKRAIAKTFFQVATIPLQKYNIFII